VNQRKKQKIKTRWMRTKAVGRRKKYRSKVTGSCHSKKGKSRRSPYALTEHRYIERMEV
jgi:hypothetical protein